MRNKDHIHSLLKEAEDKASKTMKPSDVSRATRLNAAYLETFLPENQRWPRDPKSFRILAPSEFGRTL